MNLQQAHLIASIQTLLRHDERLIYFLFHHMNPEIRLSSDELLEETLDLCRWERLLIQAALDFWNGSGHVRLSSILRSWDNENIVAFVRAILYFREIDVACLLSEELC